LKPESTQDSQTEKHFFFPRLSLFQIHFIFLTDASVSVFLSDNTTAFSDPSEGFSAPKVQQMTSTLVQKCEEWIQHVTHHLTCVLFSAVLGKHFKTVACQDRDLKSSYSFGKEVSYYTKSY